MFSIRYDNGEMVINLTRFFPASKRNLKKLVKICRLDYNSFDILMSKLEAYLINAIDHETRRSSLDQRMIDRLTTNLEYIREVIEYD